MKKNLFYIIGVSGGVLILLIVLSILAPWKRKETIVPAPTQCPIASPSPANAQITLTLYFADEEALYLFPEKRTIKQPDKPTETLIIEQLIQGPKNPKLARTIPPETRLLSINVKGETAFVNFSSELQTRHWGGTAGESMTIYSIVNSLTELPYIKKVQFLLEGKVEPSIFGHYITSEPIPRNEERIYGHDSQ